MNLPAHACGLYLTHNRHRDYYETVEELLAKVDHIDDEWASPEARQRAIDTGELWELQWYPRTPIGSHSIMAPTLEELLAFAADIEANA